MVARRQKRKDDTRNRTLPLSEGGIDVIEAKIFKHELFCVLPKRLYKIMLFRYAYCMTCQEIGIMYGLTKSRVNQLVIMAVEKLKKKKIIPENIFPKSVDNYRKNIRKCFINERDVIFDLIDFMRCYKISMLKVAVGMNVSYMSIFRWVKGKGYPNSVNADKIRKFITEKRFDLIKLPKVIKTKFQKEYFKRYFKLRYMKGYRQNYNKEKRLLASKRYYWKHIEAVRKYKREYYRRNSDVFRKKRRERYEQKLIDRKLT